MAGPIEQFEIKPIYNLEIAGYDVSFTNSSLWMIIAIVAISLVMVLGTRQRALVPGRFQAMVEMLYEFVANMVIDIAGPEARKYFPYIFTLFVFIFFGNFLGLLPMSFTYTSHFAVTFALGFMGFIIFTLIGFARHGLDYLKLFMPGGTPIMLAPILIPIELFSYFARPFSLAIRLFANMLAGHVVLKIFAGFGVALAAVHPAVGILPAFFNVGLIGFEIFVAALQAYIFSLLMCVYLNDAVHLH